MMMIKFSPSFYNNITFAFTALHHQLLPQPSRMLSSQITKLEKDPTNDDLIFNLQFIPHQSVFIHLWNRWRDRPLLQVHYWICLRRPPLHQSHLWKHYQQSRMVIIWWQYWPQQIWNICETYPSADAGLCKFHMHNALPQALDGLQDLCETSHFISVYSACPLRRESMDSSRTWACLYL